jgi:hypothetical protein
VDLVGKGRGCCGVIACGEWAQAYSGKERRTRGEEQISLNADSTIPPASVSSSIQLSPVTCPLSGTTISNQGPALWCTSGINPLAINSTTPIPKCSSFIVFSPMDAEPRWETSVGKGALVMNSTLACREREIKTNSQGFVRGGSPPGTRDSPRSQNPGLTASTRLSAVHPLHLDSFPSRPA